MSEAEQKAHKSQTERKEEVLTHGTPSTVRSISEAVVVKNGGLFFLTDSDGRVPLKDGHGFGLYYHDCRFLSGYELWLADARPDVLVATAAEGFSALFELTNPDVHTDDKTTIPKERLGMRWQRTIDGQALALRETILIHNYGVDKVEFTMSLLFRADFEDIFIVRGMLATNLGKCHPPKWEGGTLHFGYDGSDGVYRWLRIHCSPAPQATTEAAAHFAISLEGQEKYELALTLEVGETVGRSGEETEKNAPEPAIPQQKHPTHVAGSLRESAERWLSRCTEVDTDSPRVNGAISRSMQDLCMLRTNLKDLEFFAAGIPWFVTLFGRDSLIAAMQTLAFEPNTAAQTLRLLASYQGSKVDDWKDEQPGKILHELRVGELARRGSIPYTPYYGSIDSTLLFLILVGQHAAWSGSLDLFNELRENVERALSWITEYGEKPMPGYVAYQSTTKHGLINQGWKDSGDAIVDADGSLATPPIALVEVQGYVYLAKRTIADLFRRAGDADRAERLEHDAQTMRERFNRDFWLEDEGFYALALQKDMRPAAVLSSNPGQALWTGITDEEKAHKTVARLMNDDMFNDWGVRTLSDTTRRYNPVGYHLGTVWPHDNSIVAAGCRNFGHDDAALRIFDGIVAAAQNFDHDRLPEVFAGFRREAYGTPVRYPVACHPQAWAAGSLPYLMSTLLGLVPDAFSKRLHIVRPILPEGVNRVEFKRLRVGDAHVGLRFRRDGKRVSVEVLSTEGALDVVVET